MYVHRSKNIMKRFTRKPLEKSYGTNFMFKIRQKTTKSIKKFLRSCIAKVAQSSNTKCSGARLEVTGSQLAE